MSHSLRYTDGFAKSIKVQDLLGKALSCYCPSQVSVSGVALDSRLVKEGDLFVAIPCPQVLDHLQEAWAKGALALLYEEPTSTCGAGLSRRDRRALGPEATLVPVPDARQAAAKLCSVFYGPPPSVRVAVTGTNGKSSTVTWVRQLMAMAGFKSASMGTLGVTLSNPDSTEASTLPAPELTTYDPVSLHKILYELVQRNVEVVALEATSHGLDQKRLDGLSFQAGALTNITQDHLDYHHTLEAYAQAKERLFTDLIDIGGTAILNSSSAFVEDFRVACQQRSLRILTTGANVTDDLQVVRSAVTEHGTVLDLRLLGQEYEGVLLKPRGSFQVENLLTALGLCLAAQPNIPLDTWVSFIPRLGDIPGRMEKVAEKNGASIFVDFCHTPDALRRALTDLKALPHRRLWVVFGCGGDRDATKRPLMGAEASALADRVFVTDDNPRFEDPAKIRAEICSSDPKLENIPGRDCAIRQAIAELSKDDILLVAGRGHETFQKRAGQCVAFHDGTFIRQIVKHLDTEEFET